MNFSFKALLIIVIPTDCILSHQMPKGSDGSWVGKLIEKCSKYKHFDKPRFGTNCKFHNPFYRYVMTESIPFFISVAFFVKHFSDTVEYDSFSFLEKNRDTVSKELVNCLRESEMDFLRKLMELDDVEDGKQNKSTTSLGGRVVISASKSLVRTSCYTSATFLKSRLI